MEKFVKGTPESIHYLVKTDVSEVKENASSVNHPLRDLTVSGFLGPNRIWNGFGTRADTSVRREELSTRKYTGLSVDTLKAVTFVDERAAHPPPRYAQSGWLEAERVVGGRGAQHLARPASISPGRARRSVAPTPHPGSLDRAGPGYTLPPLALAGYGGCVFWSRSPCDWYPPPPEWVESTLG